MFDIRQNCFDEEYGDVNESLVNDYYTALLKAFDESPEGMPFDGNYQWPVSMMDYGFDYLGVSPGQMSVLDFKKILFELFPKKVSVDAERAGEIVAELLAFWQFIARHYPQGQRILNPLL